MSIRLFQHILILIMLKNTIARLQHFNVNELDNVPKRDLLTIPAERRTNNRRVPVVTRCGISFRWPRALHIEYAGDSSCTGGAVHRNW